MAGLSSVEYIASLKRSKHDVVEVPKKVKSLEARLADGEMVLCAEGYLLALARMGYLKPGVWVPDIIFEQPEVLRAVHKEYIHAGSDVTEAFQYCTRRENLRKIGREDDLEAINRIALKIAREVATETGTLMAGGIGHTNIYIPGDAEAEREIREMYEEQIRWAKEEGADYIVAETFSSLGEALIGVDVVKSFDLPCVCTMTFDGSMKTLDGYEIGESFCAILDKGALLTGANCSGGPNELLKVIKEAVKYVDPNKLCALPVAFRTSPEEPTMFSLTDSVSPGNKQRAYPHGLDTCQVNQSEISQFTEECVKLGLQYLGVCCGNSGTYTRAMALAMGKTPPSGKYLDLANKGFPPLEVKKSLGW